MEAATRFGIRKLAGGVQLRGRGVCAWLCGTPQMT